MPGLNSRTRGLPTSPQARRFNRSQSLWTLWATPQPLPEELTFMTVAPRFVRMLLSTSWAHCEAVYKQAGSIPSVSNAPDYPKR
jgi:hypothetical protein